MLSPKNSYNISRILPFGFIWFFLGLLFLLNDLSITHNLTGVPDTSVTLTLPVLLFALVAIFVIGLLIGTLEIVVLEKRFTRYSLLGKISLKFLVYSGLLFSLIVITYPIAASIEQGVSPFHPDIIERFLRFLKSVVFLNTVLQLSFHVFVSLMYAAISENLGHNVLKNFFTGKYHTPKVETRIFMFLDMKNSTTIAEELGHVVYFNFLRKYYDALSDPIIQHLGEVYQYVGDEIVITWEIERGIKNDNWLRCFNDLKQALEKQKSTFLSNFGVQPDFRAGIHVGEVTTGEIGALKKEIVFTGDVLNTAARLQALAKEYTTDLVFSEDLQVLLNNNSAYPTRHIGQITLRGKSRKTDVFTLSQ